MAIENNLAQLRLKRGFTAIKLAREIGVSRQTIYAMETGTYVPNTLLALKLAQVLEVTVEDLFRLEAAEAPKHTESVELLPGDQDPQPGLPVQLCDVDERLVAVLPTPTAWSLPPADAVLIEAGKRSGRGRVQLFQEEKQYRMRLMIAGCDPGISVLLRHLQREGVEAVVAYRNSSQSLNLLKDSLVHIAGTHLTDEATGESNLPAVRKYFPKGSVAVISYAIWEEGIVIARGNPKNIKSIADMGRKDVTIINREPGAGSRMLLDSHLQKAGVTPKSVKGYQQIATGHLPAAWQVKNGSADCCMATKTAACVFGLDFVPLTSERYDLVIRTKNLSHPGVQILLDTLGRTAFRRELEGLGGYDTRTAGNRLV
ncbi:MAG TPA: substrate-binding domain-containing protein [Acidobacteriota bacterium]|nr:substrate-binding domain-containing protein [Acidobacteriota bacterium]